MKALTEALSGGFVAMSEEELYDVNGGCACCKNGGSCCCGDTYVNAENNSGTIIVGDKNKQKNDSSSRDTSVNVELDVGLGGNDSDNDDAGGDGK